MRVEFPYRTSEPEGLPESFAAAAPPAEEVVFVPPQGFGGPWDRLLRSQGVEEPARALALEGGRVWVLEEADQKVDRRRISIEELLEVEIGHVLLHAWVAFAPDGEDPIRIDFNAVVLPIFEGFIDRILEELCDDGWESNQAGASGLGGLPLKFRNALRSQLLPEEALQAVAFAPAIWERRLLVLRRRLVAARALAATDRRLLVIEEGEAVRESTYGSTAYSFPRRRIAGLRRTAEGLLLSLHARNGVCERRIPLSRPESATEVIEALAGGNL